MPQKKGQWHGMDERRSFHSQQGLIQANPIKTMTCLIQHSIKHSWCFLIILAPSFTVNFRKLSQQTVEFTVLLSTKINKETKEKVLWDSSSLCWGFYKTCHFSETLKPHWSYYDQTDNINGIFSHKILKAPQNREHVNRSFLFSTCFSGCKLT